MKKFNVVAASAVALSAALAGGSALAHGTLAVGTANYNAAAVAANNGVITVPWNGSGPGVFAAYTVTNNGATPTSLEVNSRFTVTLPAGFTFASQPSLSTVAPATTALTAGGIGSQTATFTIGTAPVAGMLTLNTVSVQGATALETAGASLGITVQSTNNALVTNNDAAPVSATLPTFTSDTGVTAAFAGGGALIDLSSPSLGTTFVAGTPVNVPANTATTANIGIVTLTPSGSLGANGAVATLSTSDSATLTISGFFNGIASAAADGVTVTPSGNTLTFTNVPFGAVTAGVLTADVTLTASGTALLQQNPPSTVAALGQSGFTVNFAPGTGTTDFLGGSAANPTDSIVYTNGQVVAVSNFFTGDDAGYTSLLRVNNAGTKQATLFALVQPYTGGPQLVGSLGTLAAGTGTVFLETAVQAAVPGLTLANSGARATLTIIGAGSGVTNVAASDLLVNPGGVVVNVN